MESFIALDLKQFGGRCGRAAISGCWQQDLLRLLTLVELFAIAFGGVQNGFQLAHEVHLSFLVGHERLRDLLGLIYFHLCKLLFRQKGAVAVPADDLHLTMVDTLELPLVG